MTINIVERASEPVSPPSDVVMGPSPCTLCNLLEFPLQLGRRTSSTYVHIPSSFRRLVLVLVALLHIIHGGGHRTGIELIATASSTGPNMAWTLHMSVHWRGSSTTTWISGGGGSCELFISLCPLEHNLYVRHTNRYPRWLFGVVVSLQQRQLLFSSSSLSDFAIWGHLPSRNCHGRLVAVLVRPRVGAGEFARKTYNRFKSKL